MPLFIGLISGTSVDGVDAVLVSIDHNIALVERHTHPIPPDLRSKLLNANHDNQLRAALTLDVAMGELLSEAALELLARANLPAEQVAAIGSHGQTICHYPDDELPFTCQIGDPNIIAARTGITTIADFRRRDMALGGQGAPLAPAFHDAVFGSDDVRRAVLNIGGLANLTVLAAGSSEHVLGFDTGPGNGLMDAWTQHHLREPLDRDAAWASTGNIDTELLQALRADPYFAESPPKSTGKEYFNLRWLQEVLDQFCQSVAAHDVQRTLVELTLVTIGDCVRSAAPDCQELLVCGGGVHNPLLMNGLRIQLPTADVLTTSQRGVDADFVEAMTFAWLASRTLAGLPGNLPAVTGAHSRAPLGAIYPAAG